MHYITNYHIKSRNHLYRMTWEFLIKFASNYEPTGKKNMDRSRQQRVRP